MLEVEGINSTLYWGLQICSKWMKGVYSSAALWYIPNHSSWTIAWSNISGITRLLHELCIYVNKQGDNIQPWCIAFPIWNQSIVSYPVLTVPSWPAYRFLRRQLRGSGVPISLRIFPFVVIHRVISIVNEAEVDVFLKFSCFFYDPMDVANLIYGSSAFSKSNLNIWKFSVHILLKPGL